jgi:WG containing repeat
MRTTSLIITLTTLLTIISCRQKIEREYIDRDYFDIAANDTLSTSILYAVTDEEFLQYGARVAYVDNLGDTIIPFGKFAYYGTDTLVYYANVLESYSGGTGGRQIGIDRNQNVLFDLVMFDNGPEPFNEGLTRVLRDGKMGYANQFGQIVIPCIYDYAKWFDKGVAEVTLDATQYIDHDEHIRVESDKWIRINKQGKKIE